MILLHFHLPPQFTYELFHIYFTPIIRIQTYVFPVVLIIFNYVFLYTLTDFLTTLYRWRKQGA